MITLIVELALAFNETITNLHFGFAIKRFIFRIIYIGSCYLSSVLYVTVLLEFKSSGYHDNKRID